MKSDSRRFLCIGLGEVLRIAHRVADFVCTCPGAAPPMPESFSREFFSHPRAAV
jgi:sugar/nucleoside kinase (ribokinase family)